MTGELAVRSGMIMNCVSFSNGAVECETCMRVARYKWAGMVPGI